MKLNSLTMARNIKYAVERLEYLRAGFEQFPDEIAESRIVPVMRAAYDHLNICWNARFLSDTECPTIESDQKRLSQIISFPSDLGVGMSKSGDTFARGEKKGKPLYPTVTRERQ
jgi:hypothetical protein